MRRRAVVGSVLCAALAGAAWVGYLSRREPVPEPTAARLKNPIVLIGLDGADWQIIDPLIDQGKLPNLTRLKARSTWGHMRSSEPILSPLLWTTAVTGKPPDEHGIIDFLVPDPVTGRRSPITSRSRKVRALWNIFSERGLTSGVVAWWASWPAEPIDGRIVSDRVAYSLFDVDEAGAALTYPDGLLARIRPDIVSDERMGYEQVSRFLDMPREEFEAARRRARDNPEVAYKEPVNHLTKILAAAATYHAIALRMLREGQPDLFAVYYQGIDEVSHRFAHDMPPRMPFVSEEEFRRYHRAVEEYYIYQDELVGELLSAVSPSSTIIVMSDHGFQSGPARPEDGPADIEGKPGKWHRLYGIVMVAGEGIGAGRLDTATLYDIAPTALALAGLPLAADMRGAPLVTRQGAPEPPRIATYEVGGREPGAPHEPAGAAAPESEVDEELLRNLASLGYIGAPSASESPAAAAATLAPPTAESVTAHANLASLLVQKGDLHAAERELRAALELKPAYFPALMTLSQVLVRQGRVDEALAATRQAVATARDAEHAAYVQLALLAVRAGQAAQAANFLEALSGRRPRAAGIETALGVLSLTRGEAAGRSAAEKHYRAALAMEPASPEAMARIFQLYREEGRAGDLESAMRRALELNDRSILHHNWMGLILGGRGDSAGAEREFRRALDLAPDFGGTMANLGSLYGRTGRLDEAVAILSRALRIEPRNLEARVNLGGALAKLDRLDEAIANLEEARSMGMRSPDLLNAVGLAYAQKGLTREAIEALKESLTLSPRQPRVQALLAELTRPT
ncbi:MAG TPA: alkaline phosphatase family protein [Candidatus Polarisedimenticolia bacterium]|jgi:predicted AlkP superfamily phosphohydrolase/phosphomutase/Flp pilus assembly protein TadD